MLWIGFILIFMVSAQSPTKPLIYNETITNVSYVLEINQEIFLSFEQFTDINSINIKQVYSDGTEKSKDMTEFESDNLINNYDSLNGCVSSQRQIYIADSLRVQALISASNSIMLQDFIINSDGSRAFIITNEFVLLQIDIQTNGWIIDVAMKKQPLEKNFQDYLNITKTNLQSYVGKPNFIINSDYTSRAFIISYFGAVSFQTNNSIESNQFEFKKESYYVERDHLQNLYLDYLTLYVAAGPMGIDIYDISNDILLMIYNINANTLGFENGTFNVLNMKIWKNAFENHTDVLCILDQERGIIFVEIEGEGQFRLIPFQISIQGIIKFDNYLSTFFVVVETLGKQHYALEIFVDLDQANYFVNQIYFDELHVNDVRVFDFYALLIGVDAHRFVFHSIYKGFINPKLQYKNYFQESQLQQSKVISQYDYNSYQMRVMAALGKFTFKIFIVLDDDAYVLCKIKDQGLSNYSITLNSSSCELKNKANDYSIYSQCRYQQSIMLNTIDSPIYKKTYFKLLVSIIVILILVVGLVIITYLCYKRWGQQLKFLVRRKFKLDQQFKLETENDGQGVHLEMPNTSITQ